MSELQDRLQSALGGAYRLERELGGGGMSRVFLAEETQLARKVVVKLLPPEMAAGVNAERFRREIQLAASLQHPHIVPLLAAGQSGELFWYTMPFIEGESLRARLARESELPVALATRLLRDVADALAYAHERGIVHRDIKPDNVLLTGGHAVVTDFGVAKALSASSSESGLTSLGVALGTPSYMAPEQAAADPHIDHRADLYALGAMAYEMLGGNPPFTGSPQAVLAAHVTQTPRALSEQRASVPPELGLVVMKCLEKKPADRFQSAREVAAQLESMATPSGGMAPTSQRLPPAPARPARRRFGWVAAGLLLAASGLGAGLLFARKQPKVIAAASRIAVMPFVPTGSDTALARLGRDLVVTLTANLEGVGDIQTVDALSVLAQGHDRTIALIDGAELARRLNASSFVHGSLIRLGPNVRLDFGLYGSDSAAPIARASVTASPEDVTALTDSATWALLRQVWRARQPPTPNVAAVTTQSIPALRAFLEGEQAIARAEWLTAAEAFGRAIAADSGFGLAFWRLQYSRQWIFLPVDTLVQAKVREFRAGFPERDRLLSEGRSREVTERFPDYWPGWMAWGDHLLHTGAWGDGADPHEAVAAFERTVELNPGFLPGHEHLLWAAMLDQDSTKVPLAAAELARRGYNPTEYGWDAALLNRGFTEVVARSGILGTALRDSMAANLSRQTAGLSAFGATTLGTVGYNRAQLELNDEILRRPARGPAALMAEAVRPALLAGRGAWDSALAALDRAAAQELAPALDAYALALAGLWLGELPAAEATRRRPSDARLAQATEGERNALAWLTGLAAYLGRDRAELERSRAAVSAEPRLSRSLQALLLALEGRHGAAADSLAAADPRVGPRPARALGRYLAGRLALEAGDTAAAVRWLRFPLGLNANFEIAIGSLALGSYALRDLALVLDARGDGAAARRHWRQFLARYDLPPPARRAWVEEARARLAR